MSRDSLADRRDEFERNVWNHSQDPFQLEFDERRNLTADELGALRAVLAVMRQGATEAEVAEELRRQLLQAPDRILLFLQIAGLTRNKIIQDLRAACAATGLRVPGRPEGLARSQAWALAGPYLATRLGTVLKHIQVDDDEGGGALEALNQATWPGWIRQERAKRQGHEAEGRIATLFFNVDIPFEPSEKADNPLCRDAQVHGVSFDLVVPSAAQPRMCVKSTVHTANIGQYGESKDALEIREAAEMVRERFADDLRPLVVAMIDGVGFRSNRDGLDGVLSGADEFCQFRTLWKAVVVASACLGRSVRLALPERSAEYHSRFLDRYRKAVMVIVGDVGHYETNASAVEAGEGYILT